MSSARLSTSCDTSVQAFDGGLEVSCSADPIEGEAPLKVSFSSQVSGGSGEYSYLWQFGPDASSTHKSTVYTYKDHGVFEALLTVHSADRAGQCGQTIYVNRTIVCGDDIVEPSEQCDDGNLTVADGCDDTCKVEPFWQCTGVRSKCDGICGDGRIRGKEDCDDGNLTNGDGCNKSCKVEPGFTCTGEPSVCI